MIFGHNETSSMPELHRIICELPITFLQKNLLSFSLDLNGNYIKYDISLAPIWGIGIVEIMHAKNFTDKYNLTNLTQTSGSLVGGNSL